MDQNTIILIILSATLIISAVCAVMIRDLLKAAIALAATSAVLAIVLFLLEAPMAAVFELSVCAGLITVVFISAISLTKPATVEEKAEKAKERAKRFIILPFILAVTAVALWLAWPAMNIQLAVKTVTSTALSVQETLWNTRQTDILGQIIMILAGVFGIVVLFKEREAR